MARKHKLPRINPRYYYKDKDPRRDCLATNDIEKGNEHLDTQIPLLTCTSFIMGIFVSMGGFIFGYDTGQISGFLEMKDFLRQYGEQADDGTYYFSNVRSGLIVALVSHSYHTISRYICHQANQICSYLLEL